MGLYTEQFLPRLLHFVMRGKLFREHRPRCVGLARGRVLELGSGSGYNLPHYGPQVSEVLAVEPSRVSRRLAAKQISKAAMPVRFVELDGASLALEDRSVDTVLSTWTLCTIPDLSRALAEVRRVLRPGGRLCFLEHGRSPDAKIARWQDRLTPLHRRLTGGCHLNRPIADLVRTAGFELESLEEFEVDGPRLSAHMFLGTALPAGA